MNDGDALLRAIEANPDDDTPRLVYADWLEEHASSDAQRARAEFVRVQCAIAHEPPGERKAALAVREYQLLTRYRGEWQTASPILFSRGHAYIYPVFRATDFVKCSTCGVTSAIGPAEVARDRGPVALRGPRERGHRHRLTIRPHGRLNTAI